MVKQKIRWIGHHTGIKADKVVQNIWLDWQRALKLCIDRGGSIINLQLACQSNAVASHGRKQRRQKKSCSISRITQSKNQWKYIILYHRSNKIWRIEKETFPRPKLIVIPNQLFKTFPLFRQYGQASLSTQFSWLKLSLWLNFRPRNRWVGSLRLCAPCYWKIRWRFSVQISANSIRV